MFIVVFLCPFPVTLFHFFFLITWSKTSHNVADVFFESATNDDIFESATKVGDIFLVSATEIVECEQRPRQSAVAVISDVHKTKFLRPRPLYQNGLGGFNF